MTINWGTTSIKITKPELKSLTFNDVVKLASLSAGPKVIMTGIGGLILLVSRVFEIEGLGVIVLYVAIYNNDILTFIKQVFKIAIEYTE